MKNKIIPIIVILILAGGVGYYIWRDLNKKSTPDIDVKKQPEQLEQKNIVCDESSTSSECVKDEQKIFPEPANMPDLNRPIKNLTNLEEAAFNNAVEKINGLRNELRKNADLFDKWLSLGIYYKMAGDYEGSSEVWEYASAIRPKSSTPLNNLGDLYGYYIKDKVRAEKYFLKALEIDPNSIYLYSATADFYRSVMKDVERAKQILNKGIELNPNTSQDLKYFLDNL